MFLDVEYSVLLVSEPLCRIVSAEPLDERDGSLGDVTRELDVVDAAQDDVVDLHRVACGKRRAVIEWMFFKENVTCMENSWKTLSLNTASSLAKKMILK